ncbi:MFS transporter [Solimonas terrae]|uniref:MFS transporter n=1 Tax=Solimonas terrae TaxID=1396819 RepID=A0A6M2BLN5_9GAMM|nr:MFS transporter [Solimonas terrae]NGY03334.1 MFS transporter [Solimonas terrae]
MSTNQIDVPIQAAAIDSAMAANEINTSGAPLPLRQKIGYAFGQLIEITISSMLTLFALYYTTAVCGLPGALAGVALGAGLVIDAVADPLIGSLSDAWKSRFGRRVPFMFVGVIPLLVSFNLLFALPSSLGNTALFLWVMLLSVTIRVSTSLFALPYQALGVDLSDDYAERSSMASWRWGIGIMGTFAVIGLGYGVFLKGPGGVSHRDGYLSLTLALSVLVIVAAAISIATGLSARRPHQEDPQIEQQLYRRLVAELREVFRNATFRMLFAAIVLLQLSQGINQALAMHMSLYFWKFDTTQLQMVSFAAVLGLVVAAPIAGPLLKRSEKRTVLILGLLGMAVFTSVPVFLSLAGLLPDGTNVAAGLITASVFVSAVAFALSTIAFIAIVPDAVDEHEHLFSTRREGLFFAGWSFASKAAMGMGLLVGGVVLQVIHFPSVSAGQTIDVASISETTRMWLGLAAGPGSALLALLAVALTTRYRIDKAAHARIMHDLNSRRRG